MGRFVIHSQITILETFVPGRIAFPLVLNASLRFPRIQRNFVAEPSVTSKVLPSYCRSVHPIFELL